MSLPNKTIVWHERCLVYAGGTKFRQGCQLVGSLVQPQFLSQAATAPQGREPGSLRLAVLSLAANRKTRTNK